MRMCKRFIIGSLFVLLVLSQQAHAVAFVSTEEEFRAALENVGAEPNINFTGDITLTSDITLPSGTFTIIGNGKSLTTFDGKGLGVDNLPSGVKIHNLTIDGVINYVNNYTPGADSGPFYNTAAQVINTPVMFINNSVSDIYSYGGAIYNQGILTLNNGATFIKNSAYDEWGGAIFNASGMFTINNGATFIDNYASGDGGAISNSPMSTFIINGDSKFINNRASYGGGAIINYMGSNFNINGNVEFIGNSTYLGGAIWNEDHSIFTINGGALFKNNSASGAGGAILNSSDSTLNLISSTDNIEFTGNTASGVSNAVHFSSYSTMNLNASDTTKIIFNDSITNDGNNNVININATNAENGFIPINAPTEGKIILNADMSGFGNFSGKTGNTVNLYGGTLVLGADGVFFKNPNFRAYSGSTLDLINGKIDSLSLGSANINNMNIKIDIDMNAHTADNLKATSITGNTINLEKIRIIKDGTEGTVAVAPGFNVSLGDNAATASGPVNTYTVLNNNDGTFTLKVDKLNPSVQSSSVSSQSAFLALNNTNNIAFNRVDEVMNMMDAIKFETGIDYRHANKVAALEGNAQYSNLYGRLEHGSAWFRPFNSIENIKVDNIEGKVDSVSYGAIVGYDTPIKKLKKGYMGMMSFYGGYSGSSQEYGTVNLYQNGGFLGTLATLYKGGLYASLSTNVGGYGVLENIQGLGRSDYSLLSTSVASKAGYNFYLPKQTVLQLNGQLAYSLIASQDYTNVQGVRINSDPLHVIQLVPGIKLITNIKGWQPYLAAEVVFNPLNSMKVTANDVVLPDSSIGTYVEYGAGIQSFREDKLNGFAQVMARNGSRTGVSFKLGLKCPVGRKTDTL